MPHRERKDRYAAQSWGNYDETPLGSAANVLIPLDCDEVLVSHLVMPPTRGAWPASSCGVCRCYNHGDPELRLGRPTIISSAPGSTTGRDSSRPGRGQATPKKQPFSSLTRRPVTFETSCESRRGGPAGLELGHRRRCRFIYRVKLIACADRLRTGLRRAKRWFLGERLFRELD
jgi:hypothetical protein